MTIASICFYAVKSWLTRIWTLWLMLKKKLINCYSVHFVYFDPHCLELYRVHCVVAVNRDKKWVNLSFRCQLASVTFTNVQRKRKSIRRTSQSHSIHTALLYTFIPIFLKKIIQFPIFFLFLPCHATFLRKLQIKCVVVGGNYFLKLLFNFVNHFETRWCCR